jgi:flagellar biosynthesis/type III secretory pathway protein FliH
MDEDRFIPTRYGPGGHDGARRNDSARHGWGVDIRADRHGLPHPMRATFLQRDFSEPAPRPPAAPVLTQQDLAAARQDGFGAGQAAARAEAAASRAAAASQALATIAAALAAGRTDAAEVADQAAGALSRTLVAALRAVMPELIRRSALHEAGAMLGHVLPGLSREPRVRIDIAANLADDIATLLAGLAPAGEPMIAVTAQPGMADGEVRIQWQSGEARRRPAEIWNAVMAALNAVTEPPAIQETVNAN